LVLAATLMAADGGTESPFFFWPLILLAWQALLRPMPQLGLLAGVAVASYLGVVLAVPDVTSASLARLGLLVAFCGILVVGRLRLEEHEAEAERAGRLLRDAFWAAPVGLAVVGGEPPRVLYANQTAHAMRLFAANEEEEGTQALGCLVRQVKEERQAVGPELLALGSKAACRYFRALATPHRLNGKVAAVVCAEDVTAQVTVGEERRRFLKLASHQLRTPLTPIIGYAELLRAGQLGEGELAEAAEAIHRAGRRLERLFERMAAVVRLQHEVGRESTDVAMRDLLEELRGVAPEVLVGVELLGDANEAARCHPQSVALALRELLDNGHRFGTPPVRLAWRRRGDRVELRVSDAGKGPDPALGQEVLFGEWGEGEDSDVMPRGMGTRLGLRQARLLANLAGGDLELVRDRGNWAFLMRLAASVGADRTERSVASG
ncbi:MAG: sensor histidine kinase, partial [Acidimicrobiia bacterium]